jgi:hypothetical protein
VGAAGSPHATFQRALKAGNLTLAVTEARDLPHVDLADALALVLLIRDQAPERYGRAAGRWLGRYCAETPDAGLDDAAYLLGALSALRSRHPRTGALALVALARQRGDHRLEAVVRRWLRTPLRTSHVRADERDG